MRPTTILMNEHRLIEKVLDCLEKLAAQGVSEKRIDAEAAEQILSFLTDFADGWHHRKEEDLLFPVMQSRGFPADSGPIAVMRAEHEQGREGIRGMRESVAGAAAGCDEDLTRFVRHAQRYVSLLREHISKEDHCLFPMATNALDPNGEVELVAQFEKAEREIGESTHTECLRLVESLTERFGIKEREVKSPG